MAKPPQACSWISLKQALAAFAENISGHQGSGHIKPLHRYVSCRLVVEGGFDPDDITPRPPFEVTRRGRKHVLEHVPEAARSGERTILGGLKTKDVDVVVTRTRSTINGSFIQPPGSNRSHAACRGIPNLPLYREWENVNTSLGWLRRARAFPKRGERGFTRRLNVACGAAQTNKNDSEEAEAQDLARIRARLGCAVLFRRATHLRPEGARFTQPRATPWGTVSQYKRDRPNGPTVLPSVPDIPLI